MTDTQHSAAMEERGSLHCTHTPNRANDPVAGRICGGHSVRAAGNRRAGFGERNDNYQWQATAARAAEV